MDNKEILQSSISTDDPFYLTKRLIAAGYHELYKFMIKVSKIIPGVTDKITIDKVDHYHAEFSKYISNLLPLYDMENVKLITDGGIIGVQATYPVDYSTNTVGFHVLDEALDHNYFSVFDIEIETHEDDESISFMEFMSECKSDISSNWEYSTLLALYDAMTEPCFNNMEKHGLLHAIIYLGYGATRITKALQQLCDYINNDITLTVTGNPMSLHLLMSKYALISSSWTNIVNELCTIGYEDKESGIITVTFTPGYYRLDEEGMFYPSNCTLKFDN